MPSSCAGAWRTSTRRGQAPEIGMTGMIAPFALPCESYRPRRRVDARVGRRALRHRLGPAAADPAAVAPMVDVEEEEICRGQRTMATQRLPVMHPVALLSRKLGNPTIALGPAFRYVRLRAIRRDHMADHSPTGPVEMGAKMDYAEHDKTYARLHRRWRNTARCSASRCWSPWRSASSPAPASSPRRSSSS